LELWIIDNGASFLFSPRLKSVGKSYKNFSVNKDHVLLPRATKLKEAAKEIQQLLNVDIIKVVSNIRKIG
jgi:hypothetical protein